MPRHARLEIPGGIYHVITRGIERRAIFCDDDDRREFLKRLSNGLTATGSKCYAWVLMPNHFHLLIRTGKSSLSDLMRKLLTGYAMHFNRCHRRSGYLYQNRYKSILCQEDEYLLELVRYINLNPLRAKIVTDLSALEQYPWSGHAALAGQQSTPWQSTGEILEYFAKMKAEAQKKYLQFIADGESMGHRDDLTGGGLRRSAGGWQGVRALKKAKEYWRSDERVLGDGGFVESILKISDEALAKREKLLQQGWNIEKLVERVCEIFEIGKADIFRRGKQDRLSGARSLVAYWGRKELGLSGTELATYFGITRQSVSEAVKRGEQLVREKGHYLTN
jgi:REP element-mobilizing transposase RayT